ncbi:helix-turn-helix and ligand-binding sensor domain-containing protein [Sphingobacterium chuzhouense]|uniref:Transcriptional regulator n=1 Tax=Sphingobacterium chuzhouense TaxID=1742264 RepID=A0ABR7XQG9_9SPHI|nr:triple tyrosine motif-containing protein [Sphingobacterium chuzhouense]MBD1421423.1 transcriptional regulator [Sphingobacterium chuzhouense]
MILRILNLLFCLLLSVYCYGQSISSIGSPYVQNYTKSQYKAGNQNWSIDQGQDGVIYTANGDGVITFDGAYWEIYPLKNKVGARSVRVASDGKIYAGGKEEFGYFEKKNGKLQYHSLTYLVEPDIIQNDEIWKILFTGDSVIFQSFSKFYLLHQDKITTHYGNGEPFLFAHQATERIWLEKIPSGLSAWGPNGFTPLETRLTNVLVLLPFSANEILVGTAKEGLFLLNENGKATPWNTNSQLSQLLKEAQINNGIKIDNNTFAFGTIKNGIFIADKTGKILQHIHKRNGLQNNTVLSMVLDKQGNIWAGLDNGIDRIEVNSPFYYYKDIFGELGTVYTIKVFQDKIYLGTNQGLFYSEWTAYSYLQQLQFRFIPNSQGQVWSLETFNNQLICGHNDGTFLVKGNRIERISDWTGGWQNIQLTPNAPFFIQGNYTGIALFEDRQGWQLNYKFEEPKQAVLKLYPWENKTFWAVFNNSIQLLEVSTIDPSLKTLETFSFTEDFPDIQRITPTSIRGNTVFATDKGIFTYDKVLGKFDVYDDLNKSLGSFAQSARIKERDDATYIFINDGRFALVEWKENVIRIDSATFNVLENTVMKNYENVEFAADRFLFALDNGFVAYNPHFKHNLPIESPIIKGLQDISTLSSDSVRYLEIDKSIPYNHNNIRVLFSSPWYSSTPLRYQYQLEGYHNKWSSPSETPYIDFTNLSWGSYTFKVRAIATNGQVSNISQITFTINPPFYLQWPALLLYIVILVAVIMIIRRRIIEKIKQDKLQLRQKLRRRQEELLRREAEQNEKKFMQLKNEQLEQELEQKNRELANVATNIVYKNELLNNLQEELFHIKDKDGNKLSTDQLQKINKLVDNARSDERDWDIFEKSFNESHENFFKKLKADYPSLSPNDLKLCAYLRLNMSSKDIASLLNITTRGVEVRRYRLRKKFDLPTEKNLSEFLLER